MAASTIFGLNFEGTSEVAYDELTLAQLLYFAERASRAKTRKWQNLRKSALILPTLIDPIMSCKAYTYAISNPDDTRIPEEETG